MNNKVNHQNLLKGLLMLLAILFVMPQGTQAQNYTLGGDYVKFQKYVQPNPDEAAQYVVTTEAEAGETVTASIDPDKIPQGKYFTGVYTSQDVTLTTDWDGATFTMPAKDVTVNAVLANQEDYTIDLTSSTSAVIPMEISTLLSYMEVGGQTCSVYDKDYNWFLDLNVDGTPDLEVKSTFDQTIQDHIFSIEVLSGSGVYKTSCSFALDTPTPERYKALNFKFKEDKPLGIEATWISMAEGPFTYTGQAIEPQVTVTDGGTDVTSYFDIAYQNNVFAGESTDAKAPTVTVSAKSGQTKYQGSAQKTFTITPRVTTEGSRIAVIADPHVMPASLLTNPSNADWKTYLAGSRKLIDYSQTLLDQTVATLKSDRPELVLIVGDLTKDGEQASHNYLKGKLDELKAVGIPTLVIPGNHDLSSSDAKIYGATTTAAPTISQSDFAQLYQDYGYGPTSERESASSLTYACEPIDGLVVIGIDSGEEGQLSEATLTWVCDKAIAARGAGKQVIAMMHHPLIPHITGGEAFVSTVSVADYTTVRNRLADAGISVIFTGHFHTSDIAKDWNGDKKLSIYDVTTGSLCSYPCDYRIVTFNDALTQMQIDTQSITSAGAPLGGGDNFTTAIAKTRLSKSMENILKPRLTAKLVASGTSELAATLAVSMIAPSLVEAYIYHTEGDEHENSAAQSLLNNLNSLLESYPAYKAMASSMLEDKSNYGTDRVDQTNDRSLSVSIERAAKSIQSLEVTIAQGPFTYTGQAIEPAVTVTDGGTDVTSYFDVKYSNNTNAGKSTDAEAPTVTVKAKSGLAKYQGSVQETFTISPKPVTVTANDATKFEGDPDSELTATIDGIVKADEDKKDLITYTINRVAGEEDGKYPITVSGAKIQGNYTITFVGAEFTIIPVPASVPALDESNPFVVSEEEGGAAAGTYYALEESLARSFIKSNKTSAAQLMFPAGTTVKTKIVNGKRKITIKLPSKVVGEINAGKVKVKASIKSLPKGATVKIVVDKKVSTSRYKKLVKLLRKADFKGKIIKKSRAAEGDDVDEDEIESGVEYEVLEDCDLFFDIISDEDDDEDIEFESIMIRKPGDANGDDKVDAADIVEMVNAKEGKPTSENFSLLNADINEDGEGEVDQNDIDVVVDMIMGD
jgi:3',5'-cyclic AMP phosphodiesterase CpdA